RRARRAGRRRSARDVRGRGAASGAGSGVGKLEEEPLPLRQRASGALGALVRRLDERARPELEIHQAPDYAARKMSRALSAFTLGDLLAQEDLGLELLAGGEDALARRVAGAHTIEIEHPATWLERDWIMLTTGVRLRHRAD